MSAFSSETSTPASESAAQERLTARDPATGAVLGSVAITEPERIDEVVAAVAKVQPLWALLRVQDRARYMGRMAQAVIDDFDDLRELLGREQGRPRAEVAALELLAAIDALKWVAEDGAEVLSARRVGINRSLTIAKRARIAFEPYGVVGVIGAGSAPFAQPLGQIAGALLAGNGVVFKPAARACLAGERIARVLARAGLPEGLVRIVHGGADVGVALAQAPVSKVLFTGSPAVGRVVARACVSREKEVTVELGGKDAMLVLADAHLRRAIAGALWAGCAGAGQARGSIERVYVVREVYERFLAGLVGGARALRVGDPADPRVQVGPLASARRAEHVSALVEDALAQRRPAALRRAGQPAGLRRRLLLRARGDHRGEPPRCASCASRSTGRCWSSSRSTRSTRRSPPPTTATTASAPPSGRPTATRGCGSRASCTRAWSGSTTTSPVRPSRAARGERPRAAASGARSGGRGCTRARRRSSSPGTRPPCAACGGVPTTRPASRAMRAVAKLRSGRESDRDGAWREGALALVRMGARAFGRGLPRG